MPRKKIAVEKNKANVIDIKTKLPAENTIPTVCRQIRFYREELGIEQKELGRRIGVVGNAVCNWENGRSRPDMNLLPDICRALNISLYELFDIDDPLLRYTAGEQMLIEDYRTLNDAHKVAVTSLVSNLKTAEAFSLLPATKSLIFFSKPLAAGIGDPTEFEEEGEEVKVLISPAVSRADYIFTVNGNSMEPEYHDHDLILVQRYNGSDDINEGETGAFIVGNEMYIKNYYVDGLHSFNPDYKPMLFGEELNNTPVFYIGKVVGKIDESEIIE